MSFASPHPEPVSNEAAPEMRSSTASHASLPARPSRQDLVVKPSGPGPWMAVAVVACSLLGFSTAFFLGIGRSRVGEPTANAASFAETQPSAAGTAEGVPAPQTAFETGRPFLAEAPAQPTFADDEAARETPPAGNRYAAYDQDPGSSFSRFGGGQLTAAVEEPATDAPDQGDVITVRKPPLGGEPMASADLPPLGAANTDLQPPQPFAAGTTAAEPAPEVAAVAAEPDAVDEAPLLGESGDLPAMGGLAEAAAVAGVADPADEPDAPLPEGMLEDEPAATDDVAVADGASADLAPPATAATGTDFAPLDAAPTDFAPLGAAPSDFAPTDDGLTDPAPQGPTLADEPQPTAGGFRQMADVEPGYATPVAGDGPVAEDVMGFDDPDAPIAVTPPSSPSAFASPPPAGPSNAAPATPRYASSEAAGSDAIRAFGGSLPERPMLPAAGAPLMAEPPLAPSMPSSPAAGLAVPQSVQPGFRPSPSNGSPLAAPAFPGRGAGFGVTGVGRPGPPLLEGVQSPQVAMEKRGPREVQVGKFARYEILVRNVSSVTAHDVELFDTVPAGTSLVSTTPPAAPGAEGELTWQLGSLEPGDQARVLIEVLPTEEGEVGSVASVRFAAKASVRSLATRPALALTIEEPQAMRIGGEVPVVITVSNPGTGRATGVVLEGVLPEGLAHRAGRELEFDIGSLKPGESRSIDLVLATTGPGMHRIDVGVRADGQLEERQTVAVEVTAPTLELTAELPSRRYLQRPATCVLSMANAGTAAARSVELAAQLPPGLKFVSANNAGYYDEKNHRVLWQLEELPPAEIGSVEMVLMPIALGSQQVVAAARSPDGISDQVAHVLEVEGVAALTFSVVDSEDPIEVDGVTEYVIRVGNQGTKPAGDVQVTASMLGDLQPVDASGPVDHRIENLTVIFEPLARLAPTEDVVFRVQARGRREGDQRVQVQVTSADHTTPVTKEEVTRVYADR